MAVVEDREGVRVAALDEDDQVGGEALQRLGVSWEVIRDRVNCLLLRPPAAAGSLPSAAMTIVAESIMTRGRTYEHLEPRPALLHAGRRGPGDRRIIGFFYSSGFDTGAAGVAKDTDEVFGILAVNGWHNIVHILLGVLALAVAGNPSGARAPTVSESGSSTCCWRSGASSTATT